MTQIPQLVEGSKHAATSTLPRSPAEEFAVSIDDSTSSRRLNAQWEIGEHDPLKDVGAESVDELRRINRLLRQNSLQLARARSAQEILEIYLLHASDAAQARGGGLLRRVEGTEHEFLAIVQDGAIVDRSEWESSPFVRDDRRITRQDIAGVICRVLQGEDVWFPVDDAFGHWAPESAKFHRAQGNGSVLLWPYSIGGEVGGYVGMGFANLIPLTEVQRQTMRALSSQVTFALELHQMTAKVESAVADRERRHAAELRAGELAKANDALQELTDALSALSGMDAIVEAALRIVARIFRASATTLWDVSAEGIVRLRYWMIGSRVLRADELPLDDVFANDPVVTRLANGFTVEPDYVGQSIREHRTPVVLNHRTGTSEPDFDNFAMRHNWELELNIPLLARGEPMGTLCLYRSADDSYADSEIALAAALSKQLSLAMEASRFAEAAREKAVVVEREQAAQRRADELERVNRSLEARSRLLSVVAEVSTTLAKENSLEQAMQKTLRAVGTAASVSRVLVLEEWKRDGERQHTVFAEWTADGILTHSEAGATIFANSDAAQLLEHLYRGQPYWMRIDEIDPPLRSTFERLRIKATGGVPFFIDREYAGCVAFDDCEGVGEWSPDRIDALTAAANAIGGAFQARRSAERLAQEREQAAEGRATELAKANQALRRCAEGMVTTGKMEDTLSIFLRQAALVAGAAAGACLRRVGPTEFEFVALLDGDTLITGDALRKNAMAAAVGELSSSDPTGYFSKLAAGEKLFWTSDQLNDWYPQCAAWQRERGHGAVWDIPFSLQGNVAGYLGLAFHADSEPDTLVQETIAALVSQMAVAFEFRRISQENERVALQHQRNAFARDLHDTLAQGFTGILMQLGSLEQSTAVPDELSPFLNRIDELARTNLAEARRTVEELRFMEDAKESFSQRLAMISRNLHSSFGVNVELALSGEPIAFDPHTERELLFVVREALINSIKHAKAGRIGVKGAFNRTGMQLRVWDNGAGFSQKDCDQSGHYGMRSMQERAEQIGASLTVITELGYGTEIVIWWSEKAATA